MLGQPVVVENRAGAGGLIGINSVAKAAPDGYTIAIAPSSQLAMNVTLRDDMPFHPMKDLALLTQIVSVPEILVVTPRRAGQDARRAAWRSAKAQPGKLTFASTGPGGMPHMAMELLKFTAGMELVHAPYTGCGARRERSARRPRADDVRRRAGADGHRSRRARCARSRSAARSASPSCRMFRPRPSSACPGRGRQLVRPGRAGRDAEAGAGQALCRRERGAEAPQRSRTSSPRRASSRWATRPPTSAPTCSARSTAGAS